MPAQLFAIGNPLLDMSVHDDGTLLKKYDLKPNDAILAGDKHQPIYQELVEKYKPLYIAGGAAQNAARSAAYVLPENSVVYAGAVGNDNLAETLRAANAKEGVESAYQVVEGTPTGACAVIITGHDRSLVTNLAAAEKFDISHLRKPEIKAHIEGAKYYYLGGFFLTHGLESALEVAKHAAGQSKVFSMNLSAPFLPQFFKVQIDQILPYADIVIGNESEAEAYAESHGLAEKDAASVALAIASLPKVNASRARTVVITQGPGPTVVATSASQETKQYPTEPVKSEEIVDTNGAGDAFAGGFIGALIAGKSTEDAVKAGQKLGGLCIRQNGPALPYPKQQVL